MSRFTKRPALLFAALTAMFVAGCLGASASAEPIATAPPPADVAGLKAKIGHIIIIYQENWGFDALYGHFPGANGYANATSFAAQVDAAGNPIATEGQVLIGGKPDPNFSAFKSGAPVAPYDLGAYISPSTLTGDPNHNFYIQQAQIDGGRMDKYLAFPGSSQGALTFGYWDATNFAVGKLAQQYVLADNFHQDAFGGSFLNNMWATCACTPRLPLAQIPAKLVEPVDPNGSPTAFGGSEGRATPDGYIVNTSYTTQYPQLLGPGPAPANEFVPQLEDPTLGDRLSAANVTWKFYSGGLANALAGTPDPTFQQHHQSYLYFKNYAPGTPGAKHIVDYDSTFMNDLTSGNLPAVSWIKALGAYNEHPGYAAIGAGETFVANLVSSIQMSPVWKDALVVVVYDEAGGHYDHVAPTPVDRWGPATRVPAIFISPFAKRNFIDHTNYEVASLLRTIELRYDLAPLTKRDASAPPLLGIFDFSQPTPQAFARQSLGALPPLPDPPLPPDYRGRPITEVDIDE